MGRYAFFSTGYEYKFSFAVQPSQDIWEFGGQTFKDADEEDPVHKWTSKDLPQMKEQLKTMEEDNEWPQLDWSQFEATREGTDAMREEIDSYLGYDDQKECLYRLGCLIYHQLQYEPELEATYEL